jgi:hypothetical protein
MLIILIKLKKNNNEWYSDNKIEKSENSRKYYHNNKEKMNAPYYCECGSSTTTQNKARHNKTIKHINYMNSFNK